MKIFYSDNNGFKELYYTETRELPKLDPKKIWDIGIDGSSTSFGFAIRDVDKTETHLVTLIRDDLMGPHEFREIMFPWLADYLVGLRIRVAIYERTPEGYKPPSSHAERVMRDTEAAVKTFLHSSGYFLIESKNLIFDVFPNSWKAFNIPKTIGNRGKTDKRQNAISVLESAGMDVNKWITPYLRNQYQHDFDSFEALGLLRFGSEFILTEESKVKVYKNYSRIGSTMVLVKRFDVEDLANEIPFVSSFGGKKIPRISEFNEEHSFPENILGLHDKEFNNVLITDKTTPFAPYIDFLMEYDITDTRDYLILAVRTSRVKGVEESAINAGYKISYL